MNLFVFLRRKIKLATITIRANCLSTRVSVTFKDQIEHVWKIPKQIPKNIYLDIYRKSFLVFIFFCLSYVRHLSFSNNRFIFDYFYHDCKESLINNWKWFMTEKKTTSMWSSCRKKYVCLILNFLHIIHNFVFNIKGYIFVHFCVFRINRKFYILIYLISISCPLFDKIRRSGNKFERSSRVSFDEI